MCFHDVVCFALCSAFYIIECVLYYVVCFHDVVCFALCSAFYIIECVLYYVVCFVLCSVFCIM